VRLTQNERIVSMGLNSDVSSGLVSLTTDQAYQHLDKDIDTQLF
jgi:hypothetical protein